MFYVYCNKGSFVRWGFIVSIYFVFFYFVVLGLMNGFFYYIYEVFWESYLLLFYFMGYWKFIWKKNFSEFFRFILVGDSNEMVIFVFCFILRF